MDGRLRTQADCKHTFFSDKAAREMEKSRKRLQKATSKNSFGKTYSIQQDKSALNHQVNAIVKTRLQQNSQLNKPYLVKTKARKAEGESAAIQISLRQSDVFSKQVREVLVLSQNHRGTKRNTMGENYKSRESQKAAADAAVVNPTTLAQWGRHLSTSDIKQQITKLSGLNITKLDIDYQVVNRDSQDREYLNSDREGLPSGRSRDPSSRQSLAFQVHDERRFQTSGQYEQVSNNSKKPRKFQKQVAPVDALETQPRVSLLNRNKGNTLPAINDK